MATPITPDVCPKHKLKNSEGEKDSGEGEGTEDTERRGWQRRDGDERGTERGGQRTLREEWGQRTPCEESG